MKNKYRPLAGNVLWGVDWAISLILNVTGIRETDMVRLPIPVFKASVVG